MRRIRAMARRLAKLYRATTDAVRLEVTMLMRLHAAINKRRPHNGFIRRAYIEAGWTAQPDYGVQ